MLSRTLPKPLSQRALPHVESAVLLLAAKGVILPTRRASPRQQPAHTLQGSLCRRAFSMPAPRISQSDLPMDRYHALADATMDSLLERLEDILDEIDNEEFEIDYHSGVLTLVLGSNGTYVINKQPPNKQIWLSSPFSGPKRYNYAPSTDDWRYSRDGQAMGVLLEQELGCVLGREVRLGLVHISEAAE